MALYEDAQIITSMQEGIIMDFANMVECRDKNTGDHIKRTSLYVKTIADEMMRKKIYRDELTQRLINNMVKSAPLHDIGKIKISDSILNKPGKLTDEEFEVMKTHTTEGMKILSKTLLSTTGSGYLKESIDMAWCHHEWWNGKGYPRGLKGKIFRFPHVLWLLRTCLTPFFPGAATRSHFPLTRQFPS